MSLVGAFFELFISFLNDIEESFPSEKTKIATYKNALGIARKFNGRLFVDQFIKYTSPYKTQIENCDEHHFLDTPIEHFGVSDEAAEIGNIIKDIWKDKTTTINTKAAIWGYLQQLQKLGEQIQGNKNQ